MFGQITVDNQLWLNYSLNVQTQTPWSYGGDVGWRSSLNNAQWNQFLARPAVGYKINLTVKVAAATALFYTHFNELGDVYEFRLHQQITAEWPRFSFGYFKWRFRLDERWLNYEFQSNQFDLRARLLGSFQTRDLAISKNGQALYMLVLAEGFRSLNEEKPAIFLMNRDRIHLAMGVRINPNWHVELHYIWQMSVIPALDDLETTERILRLRVFHVLGGSK